MRHSTRRLVFHNDDFFIVLQHPHAGLLEFHLFPHKAEESLRPRVIPQFRRNLLLVQGMQDFFPRNRGIDDPLLPASGRTG